jgi:MoaA/NifB/PqqE/SkfB family radical SAM enzyme
MKGIEIDTCTISGGEPLLILDFLGLISGLRKSVKKIRIFTNATIPKVVDELVSYRPEEIVVSLDSINPRINDVGRDEGQNAIHGLTRILNKTSSYTKITVYICLSPINFESLSETIKWCYDKGVNSIQVSLVHSTKFSENAKFRWKNNSKEGIIAINKTIEILSKYNFENIDITIEYLTLLLDSICSNLLPKGHCGASQEFMTIFPDGCIRYCPHRAEILGDLTGENIKSSYDRWRGNLSEIDLEICKNENCLHMFKKLSY